MTDLTGCYLSRWFACNRHNLQTLSNSVAQLRAIIQLKVSGSSRTSPASTFLVSLGMAQLSSRNSSLFTQLLAGQTQAALSYSVSPNIWSHFLHRNSIQRQLNPCFPALKNFDIFCLVAHTTEELKMKARQATCVHLQSRCPDDHHNGTSSFLLGTVWAS